MSSERPFRLPVSLSEHLKQMTKRPPEVWERYSNPHHVANAETWPHTIEVFWEWNRRHSGITHLVKAAESELRLAKNEADDESMELVYGTMCALNEAMQVAFADFRNLLDWAIEAWQHDPLILAHGNEGIKDGEKGEEAENVVRFP